VDFYINASEQLEGAQILADSQKYRIAVTLLCLSCELFLKSLAERKDPMNPLLNSHDIVNLGNLIRDEVDFKALAPKLAFIRKYLNDSRYPYNDRIYTKIFYEECLEAVLAIKREIDFVNVRKSDFELLSEKFGNKNVSKVDKKP